MNRRTLHRLTVLALVIPALALAGGQAAARQGVTVDEVIAKNLEAKGGLEKMRGVKSLKEVVKVTMAGVGEGALTVYTKRPNMMRQEMVVAGMTSITAYDGQVAWQISPLQGITAPVALTGPMAEAIKSQSADIDGPLVDFKAKGYAVELIGTEAVGGRNAYHLKLSGKNQPVQHCYIDVTTNLEMKVIAEMPDGKMETEQSDYRDVEGLKMPFSIRYVKAGSEQARMTIEKIELNPVLDDALFRMPKGH